MTFVTRSAEITREGEGESSRPREGAGRAADPESRRPRADTAHAAGLAGGPARAGGWIDALRWRFAQRRGGAATGVQSLARAGSVVLVIVVAAASAWLIRPGDRTSEAALSVAAERAARVRLLPDLTAAGIAYPPRAVLAFADRRAVELLAAHPDGGWRLVRRYDFKQGSNARLPIDRSARDEIDALVAAIGAENVDIVIAPSDFRRMAIDEVPDGQRALASKLASYPPPAPPNALDAKRGAPRGPRLTLSKPRAVAPEPLVSSAANAAPATHGDSPNMLTLQGL
jgi:HAMP domain-containing protein